MELQGLNCVGVSLQSPVGHDITLRISMTRMTMVIVRWTIIIMIESWNYVTKSLFIGSVFKKLKWVKCFKLIRSCYNEFCHLNLDLIITLNLTISTFYFIILPVRSYFVTNLSFFFSLFFLSESGLYTNQTKFSLNKYCGLKRPLQKPNKRPV